MDEVWKDIEGYEGYYQVSNLGRVRSLDRVILRADGTSALYRSKVLVSAGSPYPGVFLSMGGTARGHRIHRLVAKAFLDNPNDYNEVDHIDGDKTNNRADNLQWCSHADNMRFATENGQMHHGPVRYKSAETKERMVADKRRAVIRDDGKVYPSITKAAEDLGVTRPAVGHVLTGLVETCKGHTFTYAL